MTAEKYKGKVELYGPNNPINLPTSYTTIFDIIGEGFIDMLKLSFTSISRVWVKVTIDSNVYYEFDLADLRNKVNLSRDEQDTYLSTARNSFADSYPVPLFFEDSLKVEVKKSSGNRKIKGGIIRYRMRGA